MVVGFYVWVSGAWRPAMTTNSPEALVPLEPQLDVEIRVFEGDVPPLTLDLPKPEWAWSA